MKRLLFLLTIGLAGCWPTVDSRNPFYTEAARVNLPALSGGWGDCQVQTNGGERLWISTSDAGSPWVFFQVAGHLYCDWLTRDGDDTYHNLYRAELGINQLRFAELDGNWLTNAMARGCVSLPAPERTVKSNLVFNATSAQWVAFLECIGTNEAAFSTNILCLTRRCNFVPARRTP